MNGIMHVHNNMLMILTAATYLSELFLFTTRVCPQGH